ncbi:hypothetical protein IMZ48_05985 [Candidatus Bathyarchaeota archaeon]|nr:hypothetical protein [Candidatus Bathyarchaeota archaeon]
MAQLLIASADTQLFLALAYGINFAVSSKCTLSAYHYEVGLNMALLALASTNLSTLMIRDYYARAKIAAVLRTLVILVSYAFVGRMIAYQFTRVSKPEEVWANKLWENTDSSILLPASCFLDPDLDPLRGLSGAELERVGGDLSGDTVTPEVVLYAFLALCFVLSHAAHLMRAIRGHRQPKQGGRGAFWGFLVLSYWIFCLGASTIVYAWCYGNVWVLRNWVHESGWMEDGGAAEKDVRGIGQLVPIVAMCFAVIWSFDRPAESKSTK